MAKDEKPSLDAKRHSLAHLLASAVKEKWPEAKLAIGPVIETGFYYDIDFGDNKINESDLAGLEKRIAHLAKQNLKFERTEKSCAEGIKAAQADKDPYKEELITDLQAKGEKIVSYYSVGSFQDLCRGGHVTHTGQIKPGSFKLDKLAGAYWRGDEKNKMLTRITA